MLIDCGLTPLDNADSFRDVLHASGRFAVGDAFHPRMAALGWAVASLESGRGRFLWCHNFGNLKASPSWIASGNTWACPLEPPNETKGLGCIRAYPTFEAGARGFWGVLTSRRYRDALSLAVSDSFKNAALLLGERGYYEADRGAYSDSIQALGDEYIARWYPDYSMPERVAGLDTESAAEKVSPGSTTLLWMVAVAGVAWVGHALISRKRR